MAEDPKDAKTGPISPPICCRRPARLREGLHWPEWVCDDCGGVAAADAITLSPLETITHPDLIEARNLLIQRMVNPLWKSAHCVGIYPTVTKDMERAIHQKAVQRIRLWLADRLNLPVERVLVREMTLAECRASWRALQGVKYAEIRDWAKAAERAGPKDPVKERRKEAVRRAENEEESPVDPARPDLDPSTEAGAPGTDPKPAPDPGPEPDPADEDMGRDDPLEEALAAERDGDDPAEVG